MTQKNFSYSEKSWKITYTGGIGLEMIVLLPSLIMLVSALHFFKKRSNNDKLPAKYGRYQRNVFTFKQSFFYNLYCQFIYFTTLFVIVILVNWEHLSSKMNNETSRAIIILLSFISNMIVHLFSDKISNNDKLLHVELRGCNF